MAQLSLVLPDEGRHWPSLRAPSDNNDHTTNNNDSSNCVVIVVNNSSNDNNDNSDNTNDSSVGGRISVQMQEVRSRI